MFDMQRWVVLDAQGVDIGVIGVGDCHVSRCNVSESSATCLQAVPNACLVAYEGALRASVWSVGLRPGWVLNGRRVGRFGRRAGSDAGVGMCIWCVSVCFRMTGEAETSAEIVRRIGAGFWRRRRPPSCAVRSLLIIICLHQNCQTPSTPSYLGRPLRPPLHPHPQAVSVQRCCFV